MLKKLILSVCLPLVAMTGFLSAVEYEIRDIGTLQTRESKAIAINNQGQILGEYNIDGSEQGKHFFVRDRDGTFHEIDESIIYKEIPQELKKTARIGIKWRFLADDGKAYGTFDNRFSFDLIMWDQKNGAVNLGKLPGSDVKAINNRGQVLISSVITTNSEGKQMRNPVIWENGQITKLPGLEGNVGIESDESYGLDMNNNGDVVGQSAVFLNYKNSIYKQIHAVIWANGQVKDLHHFIPKTAKSKAISVNNKGDVLIERDSNSSDSMKYILEKDGACMSIHFSTVEKLNDSKLAYTRDWLCKQSTLIFWTADFNKKIPNESIWLSVFEIVHVNEKNEILAQATTIYGEQHAVLLTPVVPK